MQRLNTNRSEFVSNTQKHKQIKGFGNSTPRLEAKMNALNEAEVRELHEKCVCDQDYEDLSDAEIAFLIAEKFEINDPEFDPCNVHDDAWCVLRDYNCTMDQDGTCYAHNFNVRIKCAKQILRAVMICYLIESDL